MLHDDSAMLIKEKEADVVDKIFIKEVKYRSLSTERSRSMEREKEGEANVGK